MSANKPIQFFWFRRDLRNFDNHALHLALKSGQPVKCIFIFDEHILNELPAHDKRVSYIYHHLEQLHLWLKDFGSGLFIYKGKPISIWKSLIEKHQVKGIWCNEDYEPYAIQRDKAIADLANENGIKFTAVKDQVVAKAGEVLKANQEPYTVFTPYYNQWQKVIKIQDIPDYQVTPTQVSFVQEEADFPSLKQIGFEQISLPEMTPLVPLPKQLVNYKDNRDTPAKNGTSRLSVALRFGTISIRELSKYAHQQSETFLKELVWREFFSQILQHFPNVIKTPFKENYKHFNWKLNEKLIEAWVQGRTGYPIVDAGMRELNETGWMHNRVRMIVASFFTKHLLQDYRIGEAYFAEKLLDFELASNNGNWQWAAGCGCDAAPYFRVFNPYTQQEKFDPKFEYIKQWVPEFNTFDYPKPIVEHKPARERALQFYKEQLAEIS